MSEQGHLKLVEELASKIEGDLTSEEKQAISDAGVRQLLLERLVAEVKDEARTRARHARKAKEEREKKVEPTFQRFTRNFRFQHMVLFVSCILLIVTGMPLKFPDWEPLQGFIRLLGGIESSRLIHRIGASGLIFVAAYHLLYTLLSRYGRRDFWLLLPRWKDIKDVLLQVRYMAGWSTIRPRFARFSYVEKFDYWAVYWGCVIMIGSGLILWFENEAMSVLPKFAMDIATEVHSDEALLATLAIVIWHMYNVHINPHVFPGSLMWWHGRITEERMKEEHPIEYEEVITGDESEGGQK